MERRSLILPLVPAALMALVALASPTTFEPKIVHILVVAVVAYLAAYLPTPVWLGLIAAVVGFLVDPAVHKSVGICTFDLGLAVLLGPLARSLARWITKPPVPRVDS